MVIAAGAVLGLLALGFIGLAIKAIAANNDEDERDLKEYADWERLR
jgi:hypothetical protein